VIGLSISRSRAGRREVVLATPHERDEEVTAMYAEAGIKTNGSTGRPLVAFKRNEGLTLTLSRRGLELTGFYDSCVGIEGGFLTWEEFDRLRAELWAPRRAVTREGEVQLRLDLFREERPAAPEKTTERGGGGANMAVDVKVAAPARPVATKPAARPQTGLRPEAYRRRFLLPWMGRILLRIEEASPPPTTGELGEGNNPARVDYVVKLLRVRGLVTREAAYTAAGGAPKRTLRLTERGRSAVALLRYLLRDRGGPVAMVPFEAADAYRWRPTIGVLAGKTVISVEYEADPEVEAAKADADVAEFCATVAPLLLAAEGVS